MNKWEIDFADAVAALETAYAADQRAYDELNDQNKAAWALLSVGQWPEAARTGAFAATRTSLVECENKVRAVVRRQSVAIRNARGRRLALYERRAFAETVPGDLASVGISGADIAAGVQGTRAPRAS